MLIQNPIPAARVPPTGKRRNGSPRSANTFEMRNNRSLTRIAVYLQPLVRSLYRRNARISIVNRTTTTSTFQNNPRYVVPWLVTGNYSVRTRAHESRLEPVEPTEICRENGYQREKITLFFSSALRSGGILSSVRPRSPYYCGHGGCGYASKTKYHGCQ